jgi:hypothetical protein
MRELPETKRDYQAEVYFALATVVQAVTITALGLQMVEAVRNIQTPGTGWLFFTGALSLLICVTFWYVFVTAYFSGFRLVQLSAANHFVLATTYFIIGLLQYMAIEFLNEPRTWLTCVLLLLAAALFSAWYTTHHIRMVSRPHAEQAMAKDPVTPLLVIVFLVSTASLVLWYLVPGIDTTLYRVIALSVIGIGMILIDVLAVQVFQHQLDIEG